MNINLKLEELTELNQIRGLLSSNDFETKVLGLNMFKSSDLYRKALSTFDYKVKSGKQIPVYWFVRKMEEKVQEQVNSTNTRSFTPYSDLEYMIVRIIDSILLCEGDKFIAPISFNIDRAALMQHYSPEGILTRYERVECEQQQIPAF